MVIKSNQIEQRYWKKLRKICGSSIIGASGYNMWTVLYSSADSFLRTGLHNADLISCYSAEKWLHALPDSSRVKEQFWNCNVKLNGHVNTQTSSALRLSVAYFSHRASSLCASLGVFQKSILPMHPIQYTEPDPVTNAISRSTIVSNFWSTNAIYGLRCYSN